MFPVIVAFLSAFFSIAESKALEASYRLEEGYIHHSYVKVASIEVTLDSEAYVAPHPDVCPEIRAPPRLATCLESCDYTTNDSTCNKPSDR